MRPTDWLLVFVAAEPTPVDPVRLQKGLFLLAFRGVVGRRERYRFQPYAYGPMSQQVYRDARGLVARGLLEELPAPGHHWLRLGVSAAGHAGAEALRAGADAGVVAAVAAVRREVDGLDFAALLEHVYREAPAYAVRSVFRRP